MLEPPSESLVRQLSALTLCRAQDWRSARRLVQRLAREIPAFDSVWIDALVRRGVLTPLQAQWIDAGRAAELVIGPYQITQELGPATATQTFLVRQGTRRRPSVIKRLAIPPEDRAIVFERLRKLVQSAGQLAHRSTVLPERVFEHEQWLVVESRYIAGTTAQDLLIRRGRFPASIVAEIGKQLLSAMSLLHQHGIVHGAVRLSKVRLTPRGEAVLVDGGVLPALTPRLAFYHVRQPDRVDGLAPEVLGTGQVLTPSADFYALGCLLWQLLAGRPPYLIADPLAKVAAHQSRDLEDVRRWAPETPPYLADWITALTRRNVAERPRSAVDAGHLLVTSLAAGRSRIRRWVSSRAAEGSWLSQGEPARPAAVLWLAIAFGLSGIAVTLTDARVRSSLLSVANQPAAWSGLIPSFRGQPSSATTASHTAGHPSGQAATTLDIPATGDGRPVISPFVISPVAVNHQPGLAGVPDLPGVSPVTSASPVSLGADPATGVSGSAVPSFGMSGLETPSTTQPAADRPPVELFALPAPDANGVIALQAGASYVASPVSFAGTLVVRGPTEGIATIQVSGAPWSIEAQRVQFEQVSMECQPMAGAAVVIHAQQLELSSTRWRTVGTESAPPGERVFVAWKLVRPADPRAGTLLIQNTQLTGSSMAVYVADPPRQITLKNVLKVGRGPVVAVGRTSGIWSLPIEAEQLTLRGAGPVIQLAGALVREPTSAQMVLTTRGCVLQPEGAAALIELVGPVVRSDLATSLSIEGDDTVIATGGLVLGRRASPAEGVVNLDQSEVVVEGLVFAELEFAGAADDLPAHSVLQQLDAPRRSVTMPGAALPW